MPLIEPETLNAGRLHAATLRTAPRILGHEQTSLLFLALTTGIAASLGASLFREPLCALQWLTFGTAADALLDYVDDLPWWQRLLAP